MQLLGEVVGTTLLDRGWIVANPQAADDEPLEWFWPPTAPVDYSGRPEWQHQGRLIRPHLFGPRHTPWTHPTRITRIDEVWRLEYGEAVAQEPDAPRDYVDDAELIADLDSIECWPLTVDETRTIRHERIVTMTTLLARDDHYLACEVTEPYGSRLDAIHEHRSGQNGITKDEQPSTPRKPGSLDAQWILADAEAWASAVRTARAGGPGWSVNGPEKS